MSARAERRLLDPDNLYDLHHLNPQSRHNDLRRMFAPFLKDILLSHGWTKEVFSAMISTVKIVRKDIHGAWNDLFSNMFAWEAVAQIRLWSDEDLSYRVVIINKTQEKSWNVVFGKDATPIMAIEIIKRDWWPVFPEISFFEQMILKKGNKK